MTPENCRRLSAVLERHEAQLRRMASRVNEELTASVAVAVIDGMECDLTPVLHEEHRALLAGAEGIQRWRDSLTTPSTNGTNS